MDGKAKLSHIQIFRIDEYKEWDEDGIQTKDANGEETVKNNRKKLTKEWQRQWRLHEEWLARQRKGVLA